MNAAIAANAASYEIGLLELSVEMFACVDRTLQMHDDWVDGQEGNPRKEYWDAVQYMCGVFGYDEDGELTKNATCVPANCRAMSDQVRKIAKVVGDLDRKAIPWAPAKYSGFIADLRIYRDRNYPDPNFARKESVQELSRAGVPAAQIAHKWGLVDKQGKPLLHLVQQETDRPGSVIGVTYPNPDHRRQEYAERFHNLFEKKALPQQRRYWASDEEAPVAKKREPCRESWQELFDLKPVIGIQQLMAMKQCSKEEVYAQARIHGSIEHLPRDEMDRAKKAIADKNQERALQDREERKQATNAPAPVASEEKRSGLPVAGVPDVDSPAAADVEPTEPNTETFPGDNGSGLSMEEQVRELADNNGTLVEIRERFKLKAKDVERILKETPAEA